MGSLGAHCAHYLSPATEDLNQLQWDARRFGMACVDVSALADWKGEVEKLCSQYPCTYEQEQAVENMQRFYNELVRP